MSAGPLLSRRNPDHIPVIRSALLEIYGQSSPYVKYVLRKFQHARIYSYMGEVVGVSVWKIVRRDISKPIQTEPYRKILVLKTKQFDLNLAYKMVEDMYSQTNESVVVEPATPDEERFYQYLGFLRVSCFPTVVMRLRLDE
jgi:hypothetical protein